jgi:DNA-binding transcriptional ArsR family regulator
MQRIFVANPARPLLCGFMEEPGSPARNGDRSAIAAAMAHPVRGRVLVAVAEKPQVSIRQIAARLDEPSRRVRHQLEVLQRVGLVDAAPRKNRRGGIEYLYVATAMPGLSGDEGNVVTAEQERAAALAVLRLVLTDATAAVRAGTFGSHPGHGEVRDWGEVDQAGWDELAAIHLRAYEEVRATFAAARERVQENGGSGTPVTSAMFLFESSVWPTG